MKWKQHFLNIDHIIFYKHPLIHLERELIAKVFARPGLSSKSVFPPAKIPTAHKSSMGL